MCWRRERKKDVIMERIVRPKECVKIVGFCDVHLQRLEKLGQFPPRFKLAEDSGLYGAVGWRYSDIMAWIEARASTARRPTAA